MGTSGVKVRPFVDEPDPEGYERLRRRVLWKLQGGLYLLGTRSGDQRNLMTLNWAMQVSLEPRHLAVSVEKSAVSHRLLGEGGCFAVSLLARTDKEIVRRFVKPPVHDREQGTLAGFPYRDGLSGAPILEQAIAYLDCELRHSLDVGSHTLFVGEVADAGFGPGGEGSEVLRMEDTRMNYGG